ncbi:MAG TPA: GNAT family N-acetyltransferase [Terriglobales bacterium]|nr:GNAT family N-acetyltransferase [Terriglobales bacterium]
MFLVIRRRDGKECLGVTGGSVRHGITGTGSVDEEKRARSGFRTEVVEAVAEWAHKTFGKKSFIYPVAVQNIASRRIAERLQGEIIENRTNPKSIPSFTKFHGGADVF